MGAYSTKTITRAQAVSLLNQIHLKLMSPSYGHLSDHDLEEKLDEYAYSEEHDDVLGFLYNFRVRD